MLYRDWFSHVWRHINHGIYDMYKSQELTVQHFRTFKNYLIHFVKHPVYHQIGKYMCLILFVGWTKQNNGNNIILRKRGRRYFLAAAVLTRNKETCFPLPKHLRLSERPLKKLYGNFEKNIGKIVRKRWRVDRKIFLNFGEISKKFRITEKLRNILENFGKRIAMLI